MKIIQKKVGKPSEIIEVENTLEAHQALVGGWIEIYPMTKGILLVCDEEGKIKGKDLNFVYNGEYIVGDVFFTTDNEDGEFEDLTESQIQYLQERYGGGETNG